MINLPNTYYRGTVKAIIRDGQDYVLMVREDSDFLDLPGGGIDHGLPIKEALAKELYEEIDYSGDFTMELAGAEIVERKDSTGYVLFLVYEIILASAYEPHCGKDASEVVFCNPRDYKDSKDHSLQLLYKYGARDESAVIDYSLAAS